MDVPASVMVVEVGPRDGLQSLERAYDTATKVAMIEAMLATGVTTVEATSFVHPQIVPGGSPVRVVAGVPESPPRLVVERWAVRVVVELAKLSGGHAAQSGRGAPLAASRR